MLNCTDAKWSTCLSLGGSNPAGSFLVRASCRNLTGILRMLCTSLVHALGRPLHYFFNLNLSQREFCWWCIFSQLRPVLHSFPPTWDINLTNHSLVMLPEQLHWKLFTIECLAQGYINGKWGTNMEAWLTVKTLSGDCGMLRLTNAL